MNSNIDKLHGDEGIEYLTPEAEVAIRLRTAELIAEGLQDFRQFQEVLGAIEPEETDTHLHRALMNLDKACVNEQAGLDALRTALCHIQRRIYAEAVTAWTKKFRAQAERELFETEEA